MPLHFGMLRRRSTHHCLDQHAMHGEGGLVEPSGPEAAFVPHGKVHVVLLRLVVSR
jgi:hypothetical protein